MVVSLFLKKRGIRKNGDTLFRKAPSCRHVECGTCVDGTGSLIPACSERRAAKHASVQNTKSICLLSAERRQQRGEYTYEEAISSVGTSHFADRFSPLSSLVAELQRSVSPHRRLWQIPLHAAGAVWMGVIQRRHWGPCYLLHSAARHLRSQHVQLRQGPAQLQCLLGYAFTILFWSLSEKGVFISKLLSSEEMNCPTTSPF